MSFAQASVSDLDSLRNVLQDPLTGRKVMIPFTGKAFFAGTLEPSMHQCQEQVVVKLSKDTMVDMSRSDALALLEKRIESIQEKVNKTLGTSSSSKVTPQASKPKSTTADSKESPLAFFEIREEYDDDGNEIRAEAINVVKELKYLEKDEMDQMVGSDMFSPTTMTNESDDELSHATAMYQNDNKPGVVSDLDFEKIALRLDQLARLEDEAETQKASNRMSSKTIQGSGWAKGFLNHGKKTKASTKKGIQPQAAVSVTNANDSPRPKKVGFGKNEIREIPRVGEMSVAKSTTQSRQTISASVFSGMITERPIRAQDHVVPAATQTSTAELQRKVSRFAQQRLAQQNGTAEQSIKPSRFAQERNQIR
jgi:hypothetical protein